MRDSVVSLEAVAFSNQHAIAESSLQLVPTASQQLHASVFGFLPDFTEHPKPKRKKSINDTNRVLSRQINFDEEDDDGVDVTFLQDFIAGGMAGCASVVVGHPLDTLKVRVQNSTTKFSILSSITEFGGVSSLYRGMTAPLSAAAGVNAIIFSSYGFSSKLYDLYWVDPSLTNSSNNSISHDPWQKSMTCGAFAGLIQCLIICPMEHIKCRLQVQPAKSKLYSGSFHATSVIYREYGIRRLYQGWWSTITREVPAFGVYFALYDYMKDQVNRFLAHEEEERQQHRHLTMERNNEESRPSAPVKRRNSQPDSVSSMQHTHTWIASACAGGFAGSFTWGMVYPVDVIKTKIQTASLDVPFRSLSMYRVGASLVAQYGVRHLFRGMGITLIRAFPVNGTIFPVYEFTLLYLNKLAAFS